MRAVRAGLAAVDVGQPTEVGPSVPDVVKGQRTSEPRDQRRELVEARRLLHESASVFRKARYGRYQGLSLAALGVAERALGNLDGAQHHLAEALRLSADIQAFWPLISGLPGIALILSDAGEHERAIELYALASRYPYVANSRWFEDVFGRHIDAVADTLPPDVAEGARERGRARDLEATVKELLVELTTWDSEHPEPSQP